MRAPFLVVSLFLAGCALPGGEPDGLPDGIAVFGDSISRGVNVKGDDFAEFPLHSFATGNAPGDGVESHFERLRAIDPQLDIVAFNDARSGARIADLARQAREAAPQRPAYVVVLLGANDACASPPTAPDVFASQLRAGADAVAGLGATVLVASVPDVTQLVGLFGSNATARAIWDAFDVCPGVLSPGVDLDAVRARIGAYNAALEAEASARGWRWDGGAVFETRFSEDDVSSVDLFHPSLAGQARLADVTWRAGPYSGAS